MSTMIAAAPAFVNSPSPAFAAECDEFVPSVADQCYETGRTIGLAGDNCSIFDAFPRDPSAWALGERSFYTGLIDGRRVYAEKIGRDLALAGEPCERPAKLDRRADRDFRRGWEAGAAERAEREREMAAYWQELDWEHEYELEMRDAELFNRAMFYDRRPAGMVD